MHNICNFGIPLLWLNIAWVIFRFWPGNINPVNGFALFLTDFIMIALPVLITYQKLPVLNSAKKVFGPNYKKTLIGSEIIGSYGGKQVKFEILYDRSRKENIISIPFLKKPPKKLLKRDLTNPGFFIFNFLGKYYLCFSDKYDKKSMMTEENIRKTIDICFSKRQRLEKIFFK